MYYHPILSVFSNELSSVLSSILSTHTYKTYKGWKFSIWIPRKRIQWELFCFKTCSHLNTQKIIFIFKSHLENIIWSSLEVHVLPQICLQIVVRRVDLTSEPGTFRFSFFTHQQAQTGISSDFMLRFPRENLQNCVKLI